VNAILFCFASAKYFILVHDAQIEQYLFLLAGMKQCKPNINYVLRTGTMYSLF
jgi:hypothetical protein